MKAPLRSKTALALAVICILATLVVLFGHIKSLSELNTNHLYIVLALLVSLGAGHFMQESTGPRSVGFCILFAIGTVVCVALSGGRSAAILEGNQAEAVHKAQEREDQRAKVAVALQQRNETKRIYDAADEAYKSKAQDFASECKTGKGGKCDGNKVIIEEFKSAAATKSREYVEADRHYWELADKLSASIPTTTGNPELQSFAKLIAAIVRTDDASALQWVMIVLPYCFALLTELASILFFSHAFAHSSPTQPLPQPQGAVTIADIARELKIEPRVARKLAREHNIPKPSQGWSWTKQDAEQIKLRLSSPSNHQPI